MKKQLLALLSLTMLSAVVRSQEASRPREAILPESRPASEARYEKLGDLPGVQAVVKYSDRLYRGAQPQDVKGMLELKKLGVTTILSVEEPDAEELAAAKQAGLSVINVPTEYGGIPAAVANDLVAKYREVDGIVYTHCHHGKHRGGAAGAILRMTFEGIPQDEAVQELAELGCSKRYPGLYDTIRAYRPDPAIAHRVLKPRPGIDGLVEVTPWILRGTSSLTPEALAALADLGVKTIVSADLSADAQARARAAGLAVTLVPVSGDTLDPRATSSVLSALAKHKTEKIFLHAAEDPARVATMIALFRIGMSRWSHDEAAREIEVLVPGAKGAALARLVRGFANPKTP